MVGRAVSPIAPWTCGRRCGMKRSREPLAAAGMSGCWADCGVVFRQGTLCRRGSVSRPALHRHDARSGGRSVAGRRTAHACRGRRVLHRVRQRRIVSFGAGPGAFVHPLRFESRWAPVAGNSLRGCWRIGIVIFGRWWGCRDRYSLVDVARDPGAAVRSGCEAPGLCAGPVQHHRGVGGLHGITVVCGMLPILVIPHDRPAAVLGGAKARGHRRRCGACGRACGGGSNDELFRAGDLHRIPVHGPAVGAAGTGAGHRLLGRPIRDGAGELRFRHPVFRKCRACGEAGGWCWRHGMGWSAAGRRTDAAIVPDRAAGAATARGGDGHCRLHTRFAGSFRFATEGLALFGLEDQTCRTAIVNEEAAKAMLGDETVGRSLEDPTRTR